MKIAVLYHYFKKDIIYKKNLDYFMQNGFDENFDLYLAHTHAHKFNHSRIFSLQVENKNYDYGGYCELIKHFKLRNKNYKYLIFINSSVRGPFLEKQTDMKWYDVVLKHFNESVGIVGSSINILNEDSLHSKDFEVSYPNFQKPFSHVQTTMYALPNKIFKTLFDKGFYRNNEVWTKNQTIVNYEILLSQLIKTQNYNLKCLINEYNKIDYRTRHNDFNEYSSNGDLLTDKGYFGKTPSPYQLMFIKTNRKLFSNIHINRLTSKSMRANNHFHQNLIDLTLSIYLDIISYLKKLNTYFRYLLSKIRK